MSAGEDRIAIGCFLGVVGIFILMFGNPVQTNYASCCCSLAVILLFSGYLAKNKAKNSTLVSVYTPSPQQIIHHTHVHHQNPPPQVIVNPAPQRFSQPVGTAIQWETEARNLELARDWHKAAEAYQKAGLYSEAGRIRKEHLEKEESQVKIHVDRIGHNIQDSVYMNESDKKI